MWYKGNYLFILVILLFRIAYGSSQARGPIRATAADLHHSHSNVESKLPLRLTPQFVPPPDP